MKSACVLIPNFSFHVEAQKRVYIRNEPTVIVKTVGSQQIVTGISPNLTENMLGDSLSHTLAKAGSAHVIQSDEPKYRNHWNKILDDLMQKSPLVEDAELGIAYIGLKGMEYLYRGDAQFIATLEKIIPSHFPVYFGIAESKFVAYLAALSANNRGGFKALQDDHAFIAKFPVDVLPLNASTILRLHSFGLNTLGDVSKLSISAIQAQFPYDGNKIWHFVNGREITSFNPRNYEETINETIAFSDPVNDMQAMTIGTDLLVEKAFLNPNLKGRSVRLISLEAHIYQQSNWYVRCTFKDPVGNANRALPRVHTLLNNAKLPGPIEGLSVSLKCLTRETSKQINLLPEVRRKEQIIDTVRQLDVVLGDEAPIFYIKEIEPWSRIPERRRMLVPVAR